MVFKKVKSYGSIMASFSQVVADLEAVRNREESNIDALDIKKEDINRKILYAEGEVSNCTIAIENVKNMFPNV